MPVEVILPKVDMDMAEGIVAVWHVAEGGTVARGEPLFDIETAKAAMEVESPADGTLHHVVAAEGATVPIGATVAWIYAAGEAVGDPPGGGAAAPEPEPEPGSAREPKAEAAPDPEPRPAPRAAPAGEGLRATPAARRVARERGLDLGAVPGSGPRGRVQRRDVERWGAAPAAAPADARAPEAPLPPSRRAVARAEGWLSTLSSGAGDGAPWLLLHGFAADAAQWNAVGERLGRHAPVHRIELPAHGRSPRLPVADFAALAAHVRDAFDALGDRLGDRPVRLVGHSLGGAVALALADTRPRRVADLTLIAPAGLGPRMGGDVLAGIARAGGADSLGPWLRELWGDRDALPWPFVQAAALARRDEGLRRAQAEMLARLVPDGTPAFDLVPALGRLDGPARILWGRRDRVLPWEGALRAPGRVALHLFEGLGHVPHLEAPEAVLAVLEGAAPR